MTKTQLNTQSFFEMFRYWFLNHLTDLIIIFLLVIILVSIWGLGKKK